MGVLGWTEEQTLNTTMPGIVAALNGRNRLIRNILQAFDPSDQAPIDEPATRPMSVALFDAIFPG